MTSPLFLLYYGTEDFPQRTASNKPETMMKKAKKTRLIKDLKEAQAHSVQVSREVEAIKHRPRP